MNPAPPPPDDFANLPKAELVPPRPDPVPTAGPAAYPALRTSLRPIDDGRPPESAPRPRVYAACLVIIVLVGLMLAAVGFLAYVAIVVLDRLNLGGPGKVSAPRPDPVRPTRLAKDRDTVELPGEFDAVGRGAGGRFLFLRIPSRRELAVFDPNEGRLVASIPLGSPNALFAAGAARLFVYQDGTLERWDLLTWVKEHSAPLPGAVDALVVGPGSDGPVFRVTSRDDALSVSAIDPVTLTIPERRPAFRATGWKGDLQTPVRVSDDGRLLAVGGRAPLVIWPIGRFQATPLDPAPVGHLTPSPDGRFLYSAQGVYVPAGARVVSPFREYLYSFPTAHGGDLFLSLDVDEPDGPNGTPRIQGPLGLHLTGQRAPIARLTQVEAPRGFDARDPEEVPAGERVHLWPAAGLLAVLPAGKPRIELYRVDVPGLLRKSGKSYLVFGSDPPTTAVRGSRWEYRPEVWSSREAAPVLAVRAGPVAASGPVVAWDVPADYPEPTADVELHAIHEPTGVRAVQKFTLAVVDPPEPRE
jgi:hypothetical protein